MLGVPTVAPDSESVLTTHHSLLTTKKAKRVKKEKLPEPVKPVGAVRALYFGPPPSAPSDKSSKVQSKAEKPKRVKQKNDPAKVKAARYLRDRYTEEINRGDYLVSNGKYDVSRLIENVALPKGAVPVDQKLLAA